jgi:aerobic carbon-monoxide dehydrogenase large subunit
MAIETEHHEGNLTGKWIGRSLPRKEDRPLLRGEATYAADVNPAGVLHAVFYRSPYAHAKITRVDLIAVRELPGVVLAIGADDLAKHVKYMSPFPFQSRDPFLAGNPTIKFHDRYGLAHDKVRFAGEPLAMIVAESRYIAEDALELVEADFEPLPVVLDAEEALKADAPLLYEEWGDNAALRFHVSNGDVDQAFAEADLVVKERIYHHRFTGTPIEPRGLVASYDKTENTLKLWDSTQIPHVVSALLEDSFQSPKNLKVHVIAPNIGGGYGQKWGFYPEELIVSLGSILMERPVKWIETRREHMVATNHAREQTHYLEMALKSDGTVLGLKDTIYANLGDAYPVGGFASIVTTTMYVPGMYKIQNYHCELVGVVTNKTPFGAHRGFGKSEAAYVIERMMDIAANQLGMAPEAIRFKNFIQPEDFPYVCATGSRYDSGNYPGALKRAMELADYDEMRKLQVQKRAEGKLFGIGMAAVVEPSSSTRMGSYNSGYFSTTIRMDPQGQVYVFHGGNDEGQGHWTTISQLVAEELGVDYDQVSVVEGDTRNTPYGTGSYSSRFSIVGTSSVTMAARKLKGKLQRIAGHLMEAAPDDIELVDNEARVVGDPTKKVTLQQLSRVAYHRIHDLPEGDEPGLELTEHYRDPNIEFHSKGDGRVAMFSGFPYDAEVAVIEIDEQTGFLNILRYTSVHDCGNMLNPRIVEGQHIGALAHGLGGTIYEDLTYDENGQLQNASFKDYFVPTVMEIPDWKLDHLISPSPFTPGGYKGAGETGTIGPPPCLANAVEDALRPLGVKIRTLPLSPDFVWRTIQTARANGNASGH